MPNVVSLSGGKDSTATRTGTPASSQEALAEGGKMKERELCIVCGEMTGNCGDNSLFEDGYGPLCEDCHESLAVSSLGEGCDEEVGKK